MKKFPQFTKQQLELLIVSVFIAQQHLIYPENLAKSIVDFDYAFEGMFGFENPLNKRLLVNNPMEYSGNLFTPLIDALISSELLEAH